jgi:hypothetical protein
MKAPQRAPKWKCVTILCGRGLRCKTPIPHRTVRCGDPPELRSKQPLAHIQHLRPAGGSAHVASTAARRKPDQVKLAMFGVPQFAGARHHEWSNGAPPIDDLSRLIKPTRMRVAGSRIAVRVRKARIAMSSFAIASSKRRVTKCAQPMTNWVVATRARGLRRSEVSQCSIDTSGKPAQ